MILLLTAKAAFMMSRKLAQCQQRPGQWRAPATSASVLSIRTGLRVTSAPKPMRFILASSRVPFVNASTYSGVCTYSWCQPSAATSKHLAVHVLNVAQTTLLVQAHIRVFADSMRVTWLLDDEHAWQDGNAGHVQSSAYLGGSPAAASQCLGAHPVTSPAANAP